ncbi:hypothetical protein EMMF5_003764 [Cystobasidiomycetes sp. EMM_F5]
MVASSRSASPASIRSIDIDEDTVFDDTAEGSTAPPRRSSTSAFQSVTNNGRGHTKRQSTSTRNAQKSAQGNGLGEHDAGGMVVEGVNLTGGSVLDRLLDLDYPRDFGDPVSRYQAALAYGVEPTNERTRIVKLYCKSDDARSADGALNESPPSLMGKRGEMWGTKWDPIGTQRGEVRDPEQVGISDK